MQWYLLNISALDEREYRKWYELMSGEKKERTDAFRFAEDKRRTVFSEMLVRLALAHRTGCAPEEITFSVHPGGKPYAEGISVEFNASHCGDWVACVVGDGPVGIDLERVCPVPDRVVRYVCTQQEYAFVTGTDGSCSLEMLTDRQALERFFQLWTAKEAVSKCIGTGLAQDIRQIPIRGRKIHCVTQGEYMLSICCADTCTDSITQGNVTELMA